MQVKGAAWRIFARHLGQKSRVFVVVSSNQVLIFTITQNNIVWYILLVVVVASW